MNKIKYTCITIEELNKLRTAIKGDFKDNALKMLKDIKKRAKIEEKIKKIQDLSCLTKKQEDFILERGFKYE